MLLCFYPEPTRRRETSQMPDRYRRQITPPPITPIDQRGLFTSSPPLDFFLACNGTERIGKVFVIDQRVGAISLRKSSKFAVLVFPNASTEVVRNTRIKDDATLVSHHVNEVRVHLTCRHSEPRNT